MFGITVQCLVIDAQLTPEDQGEIFSQPRQHSQTLSGLQKKAQSLEGFLGKVEALIFKFSLTKIKTKGVIKHRGSTFKSKEEQKERETATSLSVNLFQKNLRNEVSNGHQRVKKENVPVSHCLNIVGFRKSVYSDVGTPVYALYHTNLCLISVHLCFCPQGSMNTGAASLSSESLRISQSPVIAMAANSFFSLLV